MADLTGNYCWVKIVDVDSEDLEPGPRVLFHAKNGKRPPTLIEGWQLDKDYDGARVLGTTVEYRPCDSMTREQAIDWLAGSDGQAWLGHPISYFLACYATA